MHPSRLSTSLFVGLLFGACSTALGCSLHTDDETRASSADLSASSSCAELAFPRVCPGPTTLAGIDVSFYQNVIDWPKVKSSGRSFAFIRVSDGIAYPDTQFARNWPEAKRAGVVRGIYQYFRPNVNVNEQVDLLASKLAAAGGMTPGDLPPVLDFETDGGVAPGVAVTRAKAWLTAVEARLGIKPIVYTAAFMSDVIGGGLGGYTLWVANYGVTCPALPAGWTSWKFWQTTDRGAVNGITGNVDLNVFNGGLADLEALTVTKPTEAALADDVVIEPAPDGYQGATMGSGVSFDRCEPR